jgi:hypothetical protein
MAMGKNTNMTQPGIRPPPIARAAPIPTPIVAADANNELVRFKAKNPPMIIRKPNLLQER